ncbi:MAG: ABC transporter ATP-binding protein [Polyangiaceae bacterium]|nr:ABC transporter ATP-binding protein [Polyangiaceae bacterium]
MAPPQKDTPSMAPETRPKLQPKKLFGLLRYTQEHRAIYVTMLIFCVLQMATYQGLSYSLKYLINDVFPKRQVSLLFLFAAGWVSLYLVHSLFTLLAAKRRIFLIRNLITRIREELIKKLQVLSISYFDRRGTGSTSAKLLMDMDKVQQFYDWVFVNLLQAFFGVVIGVPVLFSINPTLTLFSLVYIPLVPLLQRIFRAKIVKNSYQLRNTNEKLSAAIVDFMTGIRHVRMFAAEEDQSRQVIADVRNARDIDMRYSMIMRVFGMTIQFIGEFTPVMLWVVAGVIMTRDANFQIGSVIAYVALVTFLLGQISVLFSSFDQIVSASPSVTAILGILDNDEVENPNPKLTEFVIDGSVAVKDVTFGYATRGEQRQLRKVSFDIRAGEHVAFVGRSGSGKSTVINVLLGLYPMAEGSVKFGNLDLQDLKFRTLREQIAIMNQEAFLFNTTILENLRFANRNASDEDVMEACKKAEIYDFIVSLPEGFNTVTGERGVQLSGGQRQRIAMARIFLRDFKILILDEPSSALDVLTEHTLFETLLKNIEGKTLIIIAHRLSTIKSVDRIFVFDEGEVVEAGTFGELADKDGLFARMVEASSFETAPRTHTAA